MFSKLLDFTSINCKASTELDLQLGDLLSFRNSNFGTGSHLLRSWCAERTPDMLWIAYTLGMSVSSEVELLQLIKRFGAYINTRMSNFLSAFFPYLDSRSVGTIAGLAVTIVITWKLLVPHGPRRRQSKRQGPRSSNSVLTPQSRETPTPEVCSPSSHLIRENVVDQFSRPIKPTLGQVIKQKLANGNNKAIITCCLLGIILEESGAEELKEKATLKSSVLEVLLEMAKSFDIYLMERVLDDTSEKNVLVALEEAGVFDHGGLVRDKVLFCSTEAGRISFVRQLEPHWHIDSNLNIVHQLSRFIDRQLHICSHEQDSPLPQNVMVASSLEMFFVVD